MNKIVKIWFITAIVLVVIGLLIFTTVMLLYNWDFTKLSTSDYETNTYEIREDFSNISISAATADIIFAKSDNEYCKVICHEDPKVRHTAYVTNGTLNIGYTDDRQWYDHIGINTGNITLTVFLPKTEYDSFVIENSTGEIRMNSLSLGDLDITVSTGDVFLSDMICNGDIKVKVSTGETKITDTSCRDFISSGSTGDIYLKNVIASEKFSIQRSTGDVKFDRSDAAGIFIKTSTGDVRGSLLSDKIFFADTSTGDVIVPHTTTGGRCEVSTSTGDIILNVEK